MAIKMVKGHLHGLMALNIKVIGKTIAFVVKEYCNIVMAIFMKENL